MASTPAISMAMPFTVKRSSEGLSRPLLPGLLRPSKATAAAAAKFQVRASLKDKAVAGLTATALTASMVIPEVAQAAAGSSLTPSLNNFLLSVAAGGVVLTALLGAVIGVANFDPVKRT